MALKRRKTEAAATGSMSLFEHLAELRKRIFISAAAILIGGIVGFFLWDWILRTATDPYCQAQLARGNSASSCQLYITNPVELVTTRINIALYLGVIFASPIVFWQLWRFITPGLNAKEKRYAIPFVVSSVILFVLGCVIAWVTIPKAMQFFLAVGGNEVSTLFSPTPYLRLIFLMMFLFGVAFETPLLLIFLQIAGVIKSRQLRDVRRYAIVGNAVIAAVATPSSDPYSMMAMFIPLCIFYEAAIIVGRVLKK